MSPAYWILSLLIVVFQLVSWFSRSDHTLIFFCYHGWIASWLCFSYPPPHGMWRSWARDQLQPTPLLRQHWILSPLCPGLRLNLHPRALIPLCHSRNSWIWMSSREIAMLWFPTPYFSISVFIYLPNFCRCWLQLEDILLKTFSLKINTGICTYTCFKIKNNIKTQKFWAIPCTLLSNISKQNSGLLGRNVSDALKVPVMLYQQLLKMHLLQIFSLLKEECIYLFLWV